MPISCRTPGVAVLRPASSLPASVACGGPRRGRPATASAACASRPGARRCRRRRRRRAPGSRRDVVAAGDPDRRVDAEPPAAVVGEPAADRQQRRAGDAASRAGPAGIRVALAEEGHRDAAGGQVAVADQADDLVLAQPLRQHVGRRRRCRRSAARSRSRATRGRPTNRRYSDSGLQPLGDGGELAEVVRPARRRRCPSCRSGQRQHRAVALGQRRVEVLHAADDPGRRLVRPPCGPSTAAGTSRASTGRRSAAPGAPARPAPPRPPAGRRGRGCGAAAARRRPPRRAARSAPMSNRRARRSARAACRTSRQPAAYAESATALAEAGHAPSFARAAEDRATAGSRCSDRDHRQHRSSQQRDGHRVRDAEAVQPGAHQRDDQPLGPFDQPAVDRQPRGLGAGLDVGDHLAEHEAQQRGRGGRLVVRRRRSTTTRPRRTARRRRSCRTRRPAPRRTACRSRGPGPSRRRAGRTWRSPTPRRCPEQVAVREEPQRAAPPRRGAEHGHRVRGEPGADQQRTDRIGDAGDRGTGEDVEHGAGATPTGSGMGGRERPAQPNDPARYRRLRGAVGRARRIAALISPSAATCSGVSLSNRLPDRLTCPGAASPARRSPRRSARPGAALVGGAGYLRTQPSSSRRATACESLLRDDCARSASSLIRSRAAGRLGQGDQDLVVGVRHAGVALQLPLQVSHERVDGRDEGRQTSCSCLVNHRVSAIPPSYRPC